MLKKYRLKINYPVSEDDFGMAEWIRKTELDGMECTLNNDHYSFDIKQGNFPGPSIHIDNINAAWLTEIKEPMTFEEHYRKTFRFPEYPAGHRESCHESWRAALQNHKLASEPDEQKDNEALLNWSDTHPCTGRDFLIRQFGWEAALKHARLSCCD